MGKDHFPATLPIHIYDYHDCNQFKYLEINRYSRARNERFYLKGYDFNYIIAFALSLNYYYTL